jgi:hypothetical protein
MANVNLVSRWFVGFASDLRYQRFAHFTWTSEACRQADGGMN